ncbi:hypothetical protein BACERE00187_05046 [Bacillus cereus]|nr:hypothetical protein BACERE00188_00442 [Bacillus cereus]SME40101.1 hypothetical protein BACERE00187_05046 [Bacillus cereus]
MVVPFILKLFGINVVPFGMTSVKITSLAVVLPELVMVEVKVSVSPIVANVELTVLFIDRVASTIGVTVVLVIVLPTAGDWFGFTVYS